MQRSNSIQLAAFVFATLLSCTCVLGLYEDQVGKFEWHQSYVGLVDAVYPLSSSGAVGKFLVSTKENVIAAINSNSGAIEWRKVLGAQESIKHLTMTRDAFFTITNGGTRVQSWRASDGSLLVDEPIDCAEGDQNAASNVILTKVSGVASLLLTTCNVVELRQAKSGEQTWSWKSISSSQKIIGIFAEQETELLRLGVILYDGIHQKVIRHLLNPATGELEQSDEYQVSEEVNHDQLVSLGEAQYAVLLQESKSLLVLSTSTNQPFRSFDLEFCGSNGRPSINSSIGRGSFILSCNSNHAYVVNIRDEEGNTLLKAQHHRLSGLSGKYYPSSQPKTFYGIETSKDQVKLNVYDASSAKLHSSKIVLSQSPCESASYTSFLVEAGSTSTSPIPLFMCEDGAFLAVKDEKVLWKREESLAQAKHSHILQIPAASHTIELLAAEFEQQAGLFALPRAFLKRTVTQLIELKEWIEEIILQNSQLKELVRDSFGLNRVIFVTTDLGTAFGLSSHDGNPLWKLVFRTNEHPLEIISSYVTRNIGTKSSVATILVKDTTDGVYYLVDIDPVHGKELSKTKLGTKIQQVVLLPEYDDERRHVLMIIDESNKVTVHPESQSAWSAFYKNHHGRFYYLISKLGSNIQGYHISCKESAQTTCIGKKTWTFNIPTSHQLESVAHRHPHEVPSLPLRVLGDRTYWWRYLNPNLLVVITSFDDGPKGQPESIFVYILDTITGATVYSESRSHAKGPVHAVISDNWVAYHFWNQKFSRYDMTGLEMFEESVDENSGSFTSWNSETPRVLRQVGDGFYSPYGRKLEQL
eukprot:TRINITY_DN6557_c0_g1_i2.p1 TRINITY_DN6557_c0_g1~~TRINITY_DN6557_c0_g1_i2.p1  ORF type:complete len:812 (+),score=145.25 TRINITY_DN6557_c0_g1_i2:42-2477(+)